MSEEILSRYAVLQKKAQEAGSKLISLKALREDVESRLKELSLKCQTELNITVEQLPEYVKQLESSIETSLTKIEAVLKDV